MKTTDDEEMQARRVAVGARQGSCGNVDHQ